jgi:hypothetical protein
MIVLYDKESGIFRGYKDYGVVSGITGRTVEWLRKIGDVGMVEEDSRYVIGYLHEVKSGRGGNRNGDEMVELERYSDAHIAECLDRKFYWNAELVEDAIMGYREGLPVKLIKSLEE